MANGFQVVPDDPAEEKENFVLRNGDQQGQTDNTIDKLRQFIDLHSNNKKIPTLQRLEILTLLSHARWQQVAYFEAHADAAILAVNQVQDKILEFLESGPQRTSSDIFLEVYLSILTTVATGTVLPKVTKEIVSRILKTRWALANISIGRTQLGSSFASWIKETKHLGESSQPIVDVLEKTEVGNLYSDAPYAIVDKASGILAGGVKIAQTRKRISYSPQDSVAVGFMNDVFDDARRQKGFTNELFDYVENRIRLEGKLSVDDLKEIINIIEIHTISLYSYSNSDETGDRFGLNTYVDGLKLYFEACIWSELHPVSQKIADVNGEKPYIVFKGVKPGYGVSFTDYLLSRLYNYLGSLFGGEIKGKKFTPLDQGVEELKKEERIDKVLMLADLMLFLQTKIRETATKVLEKKGFKYSPPEIIFVSDSQ